MKPLMLVLGMGLLLSTYTLYNLLRTSPDHPKSNDERGFSKKEIDYGFIESGKIIEGGLTLNDESGGDATVQADCGCVKLTKSEIVSNGLDVLGFTIDTKSLAGPFHRKIIATIREKREVADLHGWVMPSSGIYFSSNYLDLGFVAPHGHEKFSVSFICLEALCDDLTFSIDGANADAKIELIWLNSACGITEIPKGYRGGQLDLLIEPSGRSSTSTFLTVKTADKLILSIPIRWMLSGYSKQLRVVGVGYLGIAESVKVSIADLQNPEMHIPSVEGVEVVSWVKNGGKYDLIIKNTSMRGLFEVELSVSHDDSTSLLIVGMGP